MDQLVGTKEGQEKWQRERENALREPYGWLSLVELKWLGEERQLLEHFPGFWSASGNSVKFVPKVSDPLVFRDGVAVDCPVVIEVGPGISDRSMRDENGREIEVMYRFWGPAVRVRDPQAPRLKQFTHLDRFDFDEDWVLSGDVHQYEEPISITVDSAVEGGTQTVNVWAEAEIVLPTGRETTVILTGDGPESSSVMFFDETNGDTTPGWRTVKAEVDGEDLILDMNRAQIFPAHLSPFGTCPQPPEDNRIPMRVEAGEKKFSLYDVE